MIRTEEFTVHRCSKMGGECHRYRSEGRLLRGVIPTRPVGAVANTDGLVAPAHQHINAYNDRMDRSTTDSLRDVADWVKSRGGRPRLLCATPPEKSTLGKSETSPRDVYWCPSCQA